MAAGPPQGSKLATYMKGGYAAAPAPSPATGTPAPASGLDSRLKKLSISGIQEFVPSGGPSDGNGAAAPSADPAANSAAAINSFNDGGTMYFYQGDEVVSTSSEPKDIALRIDFIVYKNISQILKFTHGKLVADGPDGEWRWEWGYGGTLFCHVCQLHGVPRHAELCCRSQDTI